MENNIETFLNQNEFGAWIKNCRIAQGFNQRSFAKMIDCTVEHTSKIENGHLRPSLTLITTILDTLGYEFVLGVKKKEVIEESVEKLNIKC